MRDPTTFLQKLAIRAQVASGAEPASVARSWGLSIELVTWMCLGVRVARPAAARPQGADETAGDRQARAQAQRALRVGVVHVG